MNDATGGLAPQQSALPQPHAAAASLPDGCYLINYAPAFNADTISFSGTLRIETSAGRMLASGDLYRRLFDSSINRLPPLPDPKAGVPIFPIGDYRYYLRVTNIQPTDVGFDIAMDLMRYSKDPATLLDETQTHWVIEDALTARMGPPPPIDDPTNNRNDDFPRPEAFPSPQLVYAGQLVTSAGGTIGTLSAGFVSPFLRKATLELNSVAKSHVPRDNAAGETFASIFRKVGWDLTVTVGNTKVEEPGGESWSGREADAQMGARRALVNFDKEWHYDLLAVRKIDPVGGEMDPEETTEDNGVRGWMYDRADPTVRQGLMVASRYVIPDTPKWGEFRGLALGATTAYFRTALHEFGHALGLSHNVSDNGFMNPTDTVAANGTEDHPFPENVLWSYAPDDQNRLRHGPDVMVRPQGPDLGDPNAPTGLLVTDAFKLEAEPIQPSVALGAPVRVRLALRNMTKGPLSAPASLGLKAGNVRGRVIDASGTTRAFISFLVYGSRGPVEDVDPAQAREGSLTLIAGPDGDLFPTPGVYRIMVDARWRGVPMEGALESDLGVSAETTVTVTPA